MSPKDKLVFVMTGARSLAGGIAAANLNILAALTELAADKNSGLTVLSFLEQEGDRPVSAPDWITFEGFGGNKIKFIRRLLSVAKLRRLLCFDHVTLALPVLPSAATGFVKTVIFAHGSESWRQLRRTSRWSFHKASLCLTNSQFTLRKMRERIAHLKAAACPLGLSPAFTLNKEIPNGPEDRIEFRAADGQSYPLTDRVLLLVARMDPNERKKGHYPLISVLPEIHRRYPNVQLVFAGPGEDSKNIQDRARSQGVASAVFSLGLLPIDTLKRLYRHCYAFVMPSQQEGFGLTYLEAMNYAKPCVGCYDQGAEDIIIDGETGFLIHDPENSQELVGVLGRLLGDSERAMALGKTGFRRLHQFFTAQHYQQRVKQEISRFL